MKWWYLPAVYGILNLADIASTLLAIKLVGAVELNTLVTAQVGFAFTWALKTFAFMLIAVAGYFFYQLPYKSAPKVFGIVMIAPILIMVLVVINNCLGIVTGVTIW